MNNESTLTSTKSNHPSHLDSMQSMKMASDTKQIYHQKKKTLSKFVRQLRAGNVQQRILSRSLASQFRLPIAFRPYELIPAPMYYSSTMQILMPGTGLSIVNTAYTPNLNHMDSTVWDIFTDKLVSYHSVRLEGWQVKLKVNNPYITTIVGWTNTVDQSPDQYYQNLDWEFLKDVDVHTARNDKVFGIVTRDDWIIQDKVQHSKDGKWHVYNYRIDHGSNAGGRWLGLNDFFTAAELSSVNPPNKEFLALYDVQQNVVDQPTSTTIKQCPTLYGIGVTNWPYIETGHISNTTEFKICGYQVEAYTTLFFKGKALRAQ